MTLSTERVLEAARSGGSAAVELTPNDVPDLSTLEQQVLAFGRRHEQIAQPFEWKFTRDDLNRLAHKLDIPAAQAA